MDFTSLHCQFSSVAHLCNLFLKTGFQRYIQTLSLRDHDRLVCFLSILSVPCLRTPLSPNFLITPTLFSPRHLLFYSLHYFFETYIHPLTCVCTHTNIMSHLQIGLSNTHAYVYVYMHISCKHTFIPTMLREFTK